MPIFMLIEMVMVAIIYPIAGLRSGIGHVVVFYMTLFLHTLTARSYGMLCAAIFRQNENSGNCAVGLVTLNVIFSGTLVNPQTITPVLRWLHFLSQTYPVTLMYLHNQFDGSVVAPGVSGEKFLQDLGLAGLGLWGAFGLLLFQLVLALVLVPLCLYMSESWGRK